MAFVDSVLESERTKGRFQESVKLAGNFTKMAKKEIKNQKSSQSRATNYPIGDFLTRVKNAANAQKHEMISPSTKLITSVASCLKREGFLDEVEKVGSNLHIRLAYRRKEPIIMDLKLVSKPGLRIYMSASDIESIRGPFVMIISTPEGVLSSKEAIKKHVGGEVMAKIW